MGSEKKTLACVSIKGWDMTIGSRSPGSASFSPGKAEKSGRRGRAYLGTKHHEPKSRLVRAPRLPAFGRLECFGPVGCGSIDSEDQPDDDVVTRAEIII